MPEKDYQKIFNEYQELKAKTRLAARVMRPGGEYKADDNDLMTEAINILSGAKIKNPAPAFMPGRGRDKNNFKIV